MSRYVAFLRGINVGGHRLTSGELRSCLAELGFGDVATFRASGNVVFSAEGNDRPEKVAAQVERELARALGYEVPVFLRTAAEVTAIAGHTPFPAELVRASEGKLQVLLLLAKPAAQARKQALALATDEDRLELGERELYWLPSGRISDSDLDLRAIEGLIGPTTMRTRGTIEQIALKYFAD